MKSRTRYKKGMTMTEVLVVVVIAGILATMAVPIFMRLARRSELQEIRVIMELVRGPAKHYDLKNGIDRLIADGPLPIDIWRRLEVSLPKNLICDYKIESVASMNVWLIVYNDESEDFLYRYKLPDGPGGEINYNHPDARYLRDMRGLPR